MKRITWNLYAMAMSVKYKEEYRRLKVIIPEDQEGKVTAVAKVATKHFGQKLWHEEQKNKGFIYRNKFGV